MQYVNRLNGMVTQVKYRNMLITGLDANAWQLLLVKQKPQNLYNFM